MEAVPSPLLTLLPTPWSAPVTGLSAWVLPAHTGGGPEVWLPRFTLARGLTDWTLELVPVLAVLAMTGLYLAGTWRLAKRGDHWPAGRTVGFLLGVLAFAFATMSGIGTYDTTLLSVHMVQHMVLSMVVPVLLALGAPVTLALRTLPRGGRRALLGVLHSRVARALSFPPLTLALFVASPWALYFSGWYAASLHSDYVHQMTHLHLVLVGSLFFWPLLGVDPVPGRMSHPFRVLVTLLTLPFHAFLGVTILGQRDLIGGDWYPELHHTAMATWLPDPHADQHLAGGILWSSGDLVGLLFFGVLFTQWVRSSMREAAREDRRLDLLEAREQGRQRRAATGDAVERAVDG